MYASVDLFIELLEYLANNGELDSFHSQVDPMTGFDGLDEAVEDALTIYDSLPMPLWMKFSQAAQRHMDESGECNA